MLKNSCEKVVFHSRWITYPMTLVLILVLGVYVTKFIFEAYAAIAVSMHVEAEQVMVSLLGLIDMYMVANLLVMITQGSYQIFIRRFSNITVAETPQWLEHVDTTILKVKISASIASITLIRILKDFVNIENIQWVTIVHRMWIHGLCLISTLTLAIIWKLLQPGKTSHA